MQFYWAAAGVTGGIVSKFAHDSRLQIAGSGSSAGSRNVMRRGGHGVRHRTKPPTAPGAPSSPCAVDRHDPASRPDSAASPAAPSKPAATPRTSRPAHWTESGLWVTATALALLLFIGAGIPGGGPSAARVPGRLRAAPGRYPPGLREEHCRGGADQAVRVHACRIFFHNARRRIDATDGGEERRRRALKILGDAALEEHSEWLLPSQSVRWTRRKFCVS